MNVLFKATSDEIVFATVSQEKNNIYAKKQFKACLFPRMRIIGNGYQSKWSISTLKELTFISIHVRRTDYDYHLNYWYKLTYVSEQYFEEAMQYYKEKYQVIHLTIQQLCSYGIFKLCEKF